MARASRRHRVYWPRQRRSTAAAKALVTSRRRARLQLQQLAAALGVHPRTVARWEVGETHPSKARWAKIVAALARFAPGEAESLARVVDVPSPVPAPPPVDARAIEEALSRAADALDVSPRRVRAAVREIARATAEARGTLADLARVAEEREPEPGRGGAGAGAGGG